MRLEGLSIHHIGPVDLTVEPGECICLSGLSGSGKTLLLRAIVDLDPHHGMAYLDDRACCSFPAPEWRRRVGLLSAESKWWHELVSDHFESLEPDRLEQLGFPDQALGWHVSRCSTGERQRLALLRLLSNHPQVLLLDEPTASLDPVNVQRVETLLKTYRMKTNAAVLWVSHDSEQIRRVASRNFELQYGCLVEI